MSLLQKINRNNKYKIGLCLILFVCIINEDNILIAGNLWDVNQRQQQKNPQSAGAATWNRTWGGIGKEEGQDIWGDASGIYICGFTNATKEGDFDVLLLKYSLDGQLIYNVTWGGSVPEVANAIYGYGDILYTTGYAYNIENQTFDILVLKWNTNGTMIWNRTWGTSEDEMGNGIWVDNKSVYVIGTLKHAFSKDDMCLLKWDANGTFNWALNWKAPDIDRGFGLWGTENAVFGCGYTYNEAFGSFDACLIKWQDNGIQLWNKTWDHGISGGKYYCQAIWGISDALYLGGTVQWGGTDITDQFLSKWDLDGNLLWNQTWGTDYSEEAYSIWSNGSTVFLFGEIHEINSPSSTQDLLITKWDSNGKLLGFERWDNQAYEYGYGVWGVGNVAFVCGYTSPVHQGGNEDVLILKWEASSIDMSLKLWNIPYWYYFALGGVLVILFTIILILRKRKKDSKHQFDRPNRPKLDL